MDWRDLGKKEEEGGGEKGGERVARVKMNGKTEGVERRGRGRI